MNRKLTVTAMVSALGIALALTGCSGGLGSDGGSGDDGPYKLGMLAPFSGSQSAFGTYMKNAAQMAIDEINAAGGINGHDLTLVTADDACDATTATSAANKLVTQGIVGSVGGYCSGATLPTEQIFYDAGIPMVVAAANDMSLVASGLKSVFLVNGTAVQQAAAAVKFAAKEGATKILVIDEGDAYSKGLADEFSSQGGAAGLNVVGHDQINPTEKDFSNEATKITSSGADFVYYTGYYQAGSLVNHQAKDAGYKGVFLIGDGAVDAQFATLTGADYVTNVFGTFTQTPDMLSSDSGKKWVEDYTAKFGQAPGPYTMQSYDAVRVMAEGIKQAGSTDRDKVADAIRNLQGFTLFSGPLSWADNGTLKDAGFVIVTVKDGVFVLHDNLS